MDFDLLLSRSNVGFLRGMVVDLDQRIKGMHRAHRLLEQIESRWVRVAAEKRCARRLPQAPQRAEGIVDSGRFVAAVNHAIRTLGIS